ncbi:MAG: hypothetical protein ACRES4_04545 [Nevskiales bacterium]
MSKDARNAETAEPANSIKTRLTLRPGQNGTRKLQDKYGDRLLAVRYRYDPVRRVRIKSVEIIEEELPWSPPLPTGRDPDELVLVRIGYAETNLRQQAKAAGGIWKPESKLWRLPLSIAYALGLESRIVT